MKAARTVRPGGRWKRTHPIGHLASGLPELVHSRSREPGGSFAVRVQLDSQRLRVEVGDQGGPWDAPGRASADEQNGRGLLIVSQLAARWGCAGHSRTGWTVWYELDLDTSR